MRLFLSINLSKGLRDRITAAQDRLKETGAAVRWSPPGQFHLTVKFLGDREDAQLPDMESYGEWLAGECPAFRFRVRGVSVFPKRGPDIRTIWMGLSEGVADWKNLATKAEEAFLPFGIAREHSLVPHITLGRVKGPDGMEALKAAIAADAQTDCGEEAADYLTLVQTTLDPDGAIYRDVNRWSLRKT